MPAAIVRQVVERGEGSWSMPEDVKALYALEPVSHQPADHGRELSFAAGERVDGLGVPPEVLAGWVKDKLVSDQEPEAIS